MAKVLIENDLKDGPNGVYVEMTGGHLELTGLLMVALAMLFIRMKRQGAPSLGMCLSFALSTWRAARGMVRDGITKNGIYISGEEHGNER